MGTPPCWPVLFFLEAKTDYSSRRSRISRLGALALYAIWLCRAHNSIWRKWTNNVCFHAFHKFRIGHDCSTDVFQNEMLFEVINATVHASEQTLRGLRRVPALLGDIRETGALDYAGINGAEDPFRRSIAYPQILHKVSKWIGR